MGGMNPGMTLDFLQNLVNQEQQSKLQDSVQDMQGVLGDFQRDKYLISHPNVPLPLKLGAKQSLMDLVGEHGGKEADAILPQAEQYLNKVGTMSTLVGTLQRAKARRQQAPGQQDTDVSPQEQPSSSLPSALADLPTPGSTDRTSTAAQAGPALPSTLAPPPTGQDTLFGQPTSQAQPAATSQAQPQQVPPWLQQAAQPPPRPMLSRRQKIAEALMRFSQGYQGRFPELEARQAAAGRAQERAQEGRELAQRLVTGVQNGTVPLADAQQAWKRFTLGIEGDTTAQQVEKTTAVEEAKHKLDVKYAEEERKRRLAEARKTLTGDELKLEEERINFDYKPVEPEKSIVTIENSQTGETRKLLMDKAGHYYDGGERVAVTAPWRLEGKAGTVPNKPSDIDKIASYLTTSGRVGDPQEARKQAAELLAKRELAKSGTQEPMDPKDLATLAEMALKGVANDPAFGLSATNPNRQAYFTIKSQLARGIGIGNIAVTKADVKAGTQSVEDLTKMRGRLASFEGTAKDNLKNFLATAQAVVDSGSPFVNRPLREALKELAGSPEVAAYKAARLVVLNEFAKITTNPNLAGALSDSARQEVESISPEESTLNQIHAVAQVLLSDTDNRIRNMDEEIERRRKGIRTSITGNTDNTTTDTDTQKVRKYNPATGQLE